MGPCLFQVLDEGGQVIAGLLVVDQAPKRALAVLSLTEDVVGIGDHAVAVVHHLAELGDRFLEIIAARIGKNVGIEAGDHVVELCGNVIGPFNERLGAVHRVRSMSHGSWCRNNGRAVA